jgi:hypothetical protein
MTDIAAAKNKSYLKNSRKNILADMYNNKTDNAKNYTFFQCALIT